MDLDDVFADNGLPGFPGPEKPEIMINPVAKGPADPTPKLPQLGDDGKFPAGIKIKPVGDRPLNPMPKPLPGSGPDLGDIMTNPIREAPRDPLPKAPVPDNFAEGQQPIMITPIIVTVSTPEIGGPLGKPSRGSKGHGHGPMGHGDRRQFDHHDKPRGRKPFQAQQKGPSDKKRPGVSVIGKDTPITLDLDDTLLDRKPLRGNKASDRHGDRGPLRGNKFSDKHEAHKSSDRHGDREVVLEDDDLFDGPLAPRPRGAKNHGLPDGPGLISVEMVSVMKHNKWRRDERASRVRRREVTAVSQDKGQIRY